MFPFTILIVPVLAQMAGLPPRSGSRMVKLATVPLRIASELCRT